MRTSHDPAVTLLDSFALPACRFARMSPLSGADACDKGTVARQTICGFRIHARVAWPGVSTRFAVVPIHPHDLAPAEGIDKANGGTVIGDLAGRGHWLVAPYRSVKRDPEPQRGGALSRARYHTNTSPASWPSATVPVDVGTRPLAPRQPPAP